jgi:predicted acylesterase/phospholipase RssA
VGVTDFRRSKDSYTKYKGLLEELANAAGEDQPVTFRLAIGTYDEVISWYNTELIDVAVLQAMPVAELLSSSSEEEKTQLEEDYIGDLADLPEKRENQNIVDIFPRPGTSRDPEYNFKYRTVCVVSAADTEVTDFSSIRRLARGGQVKFLFVRPVSTTGYIIPLSFLIDQMIAPRNGQFDFTSQQTTSLKRLMRPLPEDSGKHLVAFVIDTTPYDPKESPLYDAQNPSKPVLRKIDAPELESRLSPHEVMLVNHNLKNYKEDGSTKFDIYKKLMGELFDIREKNLRANKSHSRFMFRPNRDSWISDYKVVRDALQTVRPPRRVFYRSSFDEMINNWTDDTTSTTTLPRKDETKAPRIALVLSGGGAKCAYQAGAIQEIERKLREKGLDIGLVVGTSGGAINALLVAMDVTRDAKGSAELLRETWQSFDQRDFFQPSLLFNSVFGLVFGLFQALLITIAVLLFGREVVNWKKICFVLGITMLIEFSGLKYFSVRRGYIWKILIIQACVLFFIIVAVRLFRLLHSAGMRLLQSIVTPAAERPGGARMANPLSRIAGISIRNEPDTIAERWWRLAGWMMMAVSTIELLIARGPWLGNNLDIISTNHWSHRLLMLVTLSSLWSAPWPFLLGATMVISGWKMFPPFDWNARRNGLIRGMAIGLIIISALLLLHTVLVEPSLSNTTGIERAFSTGVPRIIRRFKPDFAPPTTESGITQLESISNQILADNLLKRDLVITASRLPIDEQELPENQTGYQMSANQMDEGLYFYYRSSTVLPPFNKRFVSFKTNPEKLLDVVIGSSTIYPLFPPRTLKDVQVGSEGGTMRTVREMRIIDGGFIHNIPIEAAIEWGATHIVLVEASPTPPAHEPTNFLENTYAAFSYLFAQAQQRDSMIQSSVEVFKLQPTSPCDKLNARSNCSDDPEPNMDTFDFSKDMIDQAYDKGVADARGPKALFIRLPSLPLFQDVMGGSPSVKDASASTSR